MEKKSDLSGHPCHLRCRSDLKGNEMDSGPSSTVAFEGVPIGRGYGREGRRLSAFGVQEKQTRNPAALGVGVGTGQSLALS